MHNSKHWPRIADFGSCDANIPWDARGFKTKFVEAEGESQESVDTELQDRLDKRFAELEKREKESQASIVAQINAGKSKNPRLAAAKVKAERAKRPSSEDTGLRI